MTVALNRSDTSIISRWWFTADRALLVAVLTLMSAGVVVSLATSPAMAVKNNFDAFHYVRLHLLWLFPGLFLFLGTSLMSVRQMRRASLILFGVCIGLIIFALIVGPEIKGARRWVQIAGWSLQPSEIAKPAFVMLVAWFFSEAVARPDMPAGIFAIVSYAIFATLLVAQPDFGQAVLVTAVWGALYFLAGASLLRIGALTFAGIIGIATAYLTLPHVNARINKFFDNSSGDTYQVDTALQSFSVGGWFGRGPGEGQIKRSLPDAHTDFPYAVIGEEFGIIACLIILTIFAFIVLRVLLLTVSAKNRFASFASSGLIILVGLQAAINMAVNTGLLPAKGMTLPFLSYGGSSFLGLSITMGFVLGLTRRSVLQSSGDEISEDFEHEDDN